MGFSGVSIGNRVGHESMDITYRYAHIFPTEQTQMAKLLSEEFKEAQRNERHTQISDNQFPYLSQIEERN